MRYLDLTLSSAPENLALDEALLDEAEEHSAGGECLRVWEAAAPLVVIGRSSKIESEVHLAECARRGIPVLRRASGGAAIVAGPGCLMYAVVISYRRDPRLRAVDRAHPFVLERMAAALAALVPGIEQRGISDLALGERKFSGNSMRCRQGHFLYHGTMLYDFSLELIAACLGTPPRQPDYRRQRDHAGFVTNVSLDPQQVKAALRDAWNARDPYQPWPAARTAALVAQRYGCDSWHRRL